MIEQVDSTNDFSSLRSAARRISPDEFELSATSLLEWPEDIETLTTADYRSTSSDGRWSVDVCESFRSVGWSLWRDRWSPTAPDVRFSDTDASDSDKTFQSEPPITIGYLSPVYFPSSSFHSCRMKTKPND